MRDILSVHVASGLRTVFNRPSHLDSQFESAVSDHPDDYQAYPKYTARRVRDTHLNTEQRNRLRDILFEPTGSQTNRALRLADQLFSDPARVSPIFSSSTMKQ